MATTDFITKVLPPSPRTDFVVRPKLLNQLHSASSRKVTLIQAPAGYGKTTLLCQFISDVEIPVCWVSLDHADRDPMKLLQDIVASISQRFPYFATYVDVPDGELRSSGTSWHDKLVSVLNEAYQQIPEIFIIILDDFHKVEDNPEIIQLLEDTLTHLPDNLRLFLVSRTRPKLPSLPKLRTQRQLARLTEAELQFTADDVTEFFRLAYQREIDDAQAAGLVDQTHGWIAAIVLLAENAATNMPLDMTPESEEDLFQYLASEIFSQQPEDLKHFLLKTSIL